jgi:hypothetical protein
MLAGPMLPPTPVRALATATLAAVVLVGGGGPTVAGVEAIPHEGGGVLPDRTHGAIVGDVDGDGVRELVRLVPWSSSRGLLAVEIVTTEGDEPATWGQWLVERAATPDDHVAGNNPDESERLPLSTSEPARLIAWRDGDGERVLLATMQGEPGSAAIERSCCLTLWWVGTDVNGATQLRYIQNTAASAAWIVAADMNADGTDELAVVETPNPTVPNASEVMVLRWNGRDFERLRGEAREGLISGPLTVFGDSDGLPGEEVGYVAQPASPGATTPTLHRFGLVDGALRIERTELPASGGVVPIAGPDGGRLALISPGGVDLLHWPAAARDATVQASSGRGGEPLGVLGTGATARLLVLRDGAVQLLDGSLRSRLDLSGGPSAGRFAATSLPPYHGELHGGDEAGATAMVFGGRLLLAPEASSDPATFRDIAVLAGKTPIGLFGDALAWAAVGDGQALPADRRGGGLLGGSSTRAGEVAIVPADALFSPEIDGGLLQPHIVGGVLDGSQPAGPTIVTRGEVRARLAAPPDSVLQVTSRDGEPSEGAMAGGGTADVVLIPPLESGDNETFTVRLLVSTPAGHGYGATWQARVLRQPPALHASVPFAPLAFSVPVSGRTAAGAQVVIDGSPVEVAADGSFSAEVGAGLLPRSVRVAATDPVGNTNEIMLEVVAILDYRQLPWVPLVVVLTLFAGIVLYLRAPRPSSTGAQHPDDGVLEDIQ